MSGGQDAATALYVSSMAILAFPGAGAGLELRFFLRGGWRVSILRRRLAVSDCPYSACRALLAGYAGSFRVSWFLLVSANLLSEFYVLSLSAPCVWAVPKCGVDKELLWQWPTLM